MSGYSQKVNRWFWFSHYAASVLQSLNKKSNFLPNKIWEGKWGVLFKRYEDFVAEEKWVCQVIFLAEVSWNSVSCFYLLYFACCCHFPSTRPVVWPREQKQQQKNIGLEQSIFFWWFRSLNFLLLGVRGQWVRHKRAQLRTERPKEEKEPLLLAVAWDLLICNVKILVNLKFVNNLNSSEILF